jgi:hypothetical protein
LIPDWNAAPPSTIEGESPHCIYRKFPKLQPINAQAELAEPPQEQLFDCGVSAITNPVPSPLPQRFTAWIFQKRF